MNDLRSPLTEHFSRWEFVTSETAARKEIDNTPPPAAWLALKDLAVNILEPARVDCGPLRITSGYRSPALNIAIGGATNSQHCRGEACDVIPLVVPMEKLFVWIYKQGQFDQLIWEFSEWIHVSYVETGRRGMVLLAHKNNGKTAYAPLTPEQMAGW